MAGKDSNSPLSQVMRFSSETLAPCDRIAQWREVFGRQVFRIDIEPLPDSQFIGDVTLHALPGLKHMSGIVGHGVRAARTQELISDGNDDLNLTVNLTGSICVSQRGEELVLRDRQAVFTSLGEVGGLVRDMPGKSLGLNIPRAAIAPLVPGLDDALMRPIPRDCAALRLLTSYVGVLQDIASPAEPDLCRLIVNEIYDLVAVTIGASRDAREVANGRGVRAARLHAIKTDIAGNLGRDLSGDAVAARHGITPRYMRSLFESEATTFSDFVLGQRLARAHRMLCDPGCAARTIAAIGFECGFGDLSYFYRAFRRKYGGTPSDVRAAGLREPGA
jgi:AraC-like DNA-binding protein